MGRRSLGPADGFPSSWSLSASFSAHGTLSLSIILRIRVSEMYWDSGPGAHAQVDHLDEHLEAHGKVNISFRDVLTEPLEQEGHANEQQKTERQHLHGR